MAPPEVAGNSAPGCVIISIFSIAFAGIPSKKAFSSVVEIFSGLPSIKHLIAFLDTSFQQYQKQLNLVVFLSLLKQNPYLN
jgi:hypothetical protein